MKKVEHSCRYEQGLTCAFGHRHGKNRCKDFRPKEDKSSGLEATERYAQRRVKRESRKVLKEVRSKQDGRN